jgi:flagellar assembly factor FliW
MEIKSRIFGEQIIDPNTIISFPKGIPGFENQTRFKLFHQEGKPIIYWLQSLDDENLIFSVAHPAIFNINYSFVLTDAEEALLQLENIDDVLILILLHKDESDSGSHYPTIKGSIKSPLIINGAKRIGMQKVLAHTEQSITLTEAHNEIDVTEAA